MDLMTLAAKIQLDDSSYVKGVGNAEKMGQQLAGKLSAMTVAVGNVVADMMRKAINGVQNIIGGAIDGYADYQQLIGGVETLFKDSASKVQGYARNAYKTAGLSANQYMETVTGFSASLLQGLKGDTEQAAEIANIAVTDMADNANKMGTDMSSIQAAYQGFAKQNFTMLDNLKLGYGGTREEMIRLINDSGILEEEISDLDGITFDQLVLAIHKIQTEMGITGTTAKEAAETISGSKASLAAAWGDLLSAVGGEGDQQRLDEAMENFKTSFSTYMENFIPTLVTTISNSGQLVQAVADAISDLPTTLISQIGVSMLGAGTDMTEALGGVTHWLITSITDMFNNAKANQTDIENFGKAIGDFIGTTIGEIIANAPDIVEGITQVGISLAGGLIEGLFQGLFGTGAEVDKITEQLQSDLTDIDMNSAKATGILRYMDKLYEKYGAGVSAMAEWQAAQKELEAVMPGAGEVFEQYGDDVAGAVNQLQALNKELRQAAIVAGIEKAMYDMQEMYGEQLGKAEIARQQAEIAREQKQAAQEAMEASVKAYAERYVRLNEGKANPEDYANYDELTAAYVEIARGIVNGDKSVTGAWGDQALMNILTQGVGENFWMENGLMSPSALKDFEGKLEALDKTIESKQKEADEAEAQAQKTWEEMQVAEIALKNTIERQSASYDQAATDVETGGASVLGALEGAAAKIASIQFPSPDYGPAHYMPRAVGIEWVPENGLRTELHRGEAVLTKAEADAWRKGGVNAGQVAGMISDAIESSMSKIAVMMSGEKVGDLTTRRVQKNISAYNYAKLRSMGG